MIDAVLNWLFDFVNSFWDLLWWALYGTLKGLLNLLGFLVSTVFSGLLSIVYTLVSTLDLGSMAVDAAATWGGLDPNIAYMVKGCGIPQGLTMLGAAYGIRIILNLIPASLTRV